MLFFIYEGGMIIVKFIGVIFCILSILLTYKKLTLIVFGKSAIGSIVGFDGMVRGTKGVAAYPYLVKFEYNNQIYIAKSLESALGNYNDVFSEKNCYRKITVFFNENNPEIVTIKEFKGIYVISFGMFLLGILGIWI